MRYLIAIISLFISMPAFAEPAKGPAKIIDGDTIILNESRIDLSGIDAPELNQPCLNETNAEYWCGLRAKEYLKYFIGDNDVACRNFKIVKQTTLSGECFVDNKSLNKLMVMAGQAIALDASTYGSLQEQAIVARKGMWIGSFIAPSDHLSKKEGSPRLSADNPPANKVVDAPLSASSDDTNDQGRRRPRRAADRKRR